MKICKLSFDDTLAPYIEILRTTSAIAWQTSRPLYSMVFHLNEICGFNLKRVNNIKFTLNKKNTSNGTEILCAAYLFNHKIEKNSYLLVESSYQNRTEIKHLSYYDKTLYIIGHDSYEKAQKIHKTIQKPIDHQNIPECMRREKLRDYLNNEIIIQHIFLDFADPDNVYSSLPRPTKTKSNNIADFLNFQKNYALSLIIEAYPMLPMSCLDEG